MKAVSLIFSAECNGYIHSPFLPGSFYLKYLKDVLWGVGDQCWPVGQFVGPTLFSRLKYWTSEEEAQWFWWSDSSLPLVPSWLPWLSPRTGQSFLPIFMSESGYRDGNYSWKLPVYTLVLNMCLNQRPRTDQGYIEGYHWLKLLLIGSDYIGPGLRHDMSALFLIVTKANGQWIKRSLSCFFC